MSARSFTHSKLTSFTHPPGLSTHSHTGSHLKQCQTSNISDTLVGDSIVDHSGVVIASPVGAAPTTSSFLT